MKKIVKKTRDIVWLIKPYWVYSTAYFILSLLFWMIVVPLSRILLVIFPSQVMSALDSDASWGQILWFVIVFQCVLLLIPLLEDAYMHFVENIATTKVELQIKRNVYMQALKTDYKYIDDPDYYDKYQWAIDQHTAKSSEAFSFVNRILSAVVVVVSLVSIIAENNFFIVLLCMAGMVIRTLVSIRYNRVDMKMEEEFVPVDRKLEYTRRLFYLKDFTADLKSTNLKEYLFKNFDAMRQKKMAVQKKYGKSFFIWSAISDIVYRVIMIAIILLIAYNIYIGNILGSATYITMMLAVEKLDNYLFELFDLIKSGDRLQLYGVKIREFFEVDSIIEASTVNDTAHPGSGAFSVEFHNVGFQYPNSGFRIHNMNLHIKAGEKIAIVGRNGVGKSTLVKLLMRFYDVEEGRISIDGKDIRTFDVAEFRGRVGAAFQNSNIYAMTFEENLSLYGNVTDETLQAVIDQTGLSHVLEKNQATLTTEITKEFDEAGIELSGGEIQKMAIARLLTRDFGLLLFDEPSSALDPISEYEMTKLIMDSSNRTTTIIIAHRLSTIRNADRIIVMDEGTIKEVGTHDELMQARREYYDMFTKQAENYT